MISIMFVDDDPSVLFALRLIFRSEGYAVRTAPDAQQAIALCESKPADVVVADYKLPDMDGIQLLRHLRRACPGSVRILLTANADLQVALAAINEGEVYRLLTKPWNNARLRLTVRQAAETIGRRPRPPEPAPPARRCVRPLVDRLERTHPGITRVRRTQDGRVVLDEDAEIALDALVASCLGSPTQGARWAEGAA